MLGMAIRNRTASAAALVLTVVGIVACSGPVRHQGPIRLISDDGPASEMNAVMIGPTLDAVRTELSKVDSNLCSEQQCWSRVASEPGEEYLATVAGTRCGPLKFYSASVTADALALVFEYKANQCGGAASQSPLEPLSVFSITRPSGSALPNLIRITS